MMFSRKKKPSVPSRRLASAEPSSSVDRGSQFRRNRTLSGVRRDPMDPSHSPRSQVHHLTNQRRKVTGIFLLILIGITVLTLVITQLTARVVIGGSSKALTSKIDSSRYETAINSYLGIHPASRFRFALDEKDLSSYVAGVTPEVDHITQNGSTNLVETRFILSFRKPVAGWMINGHQYYVDDQGIVFEKNYYETPTVQIVDESGISPEQGTAVASARLLSFVGRVVALSKESGYEVTQAILPSGTTRQLEIRYKDVQPLVKLSIDRGAGEQVEDTVRSLRYLTSNGTGAQYVDVRVSGRAVYR
ncbi:MAG: hypothetical protein JWM52_715 [Candidatus Saccharibacteria bacterium]|nr:hypothetical protein [Candidatus Saccharibacteria bacterium]